MLAFVFLLLKKSTSFGIEPVNIVAVLFYRHFDGRAGVLDVIHILDFFQRHRTSSVNVEIWFQLPVAGGGPQKKPEFFAGWVAPPQTPLIAPPGWVPRKLCVGATPQKNTDKKKFSPPHPTDPHTLH